MLHPCPGLTITALPGNLGPYAVASAECWTLSDVIFFVQFIPLLFPGSFSGVGDTRFFVFFPVFQVAKLLRLVGKCVRRQRRAGGWIKC